MTVKSTPRVPAYRHHRPTGQAVVTLDGQDYYLGKHGSDVSHARYNRLIAEWLANGRKLRIAGGDLTIVEVVARYWPHVEQYYRKNGRPTSEVTSVRSALQPLKDIYGRTPAKDFGPMALKTLRHTMIEKGWCRKHVNGQISRIKAMFKWAVENELVPAAVHHGLQAVAGLRKGRTEVRESKPVRPVPDHLVDALESHVSRQVWAMIQLQRFTGMRPGEVTIMRGCDLDTSGKVWTYTPATHKTEHHGIARPIHLGPRAQEIIKPFLKTDLNSYLFSPADAERERHMRLRMNRKTRVQPSQRERAEARRKQAGRRKRPPMDRYRTDTFCAAISEGSKKAFPAPNGLTGDVARNWREKNPEAVGAWDRDHHWHPHQLRHNAATWLRKEFGIEAARVILGHRSAAITEVYAELDSMKAADIMARVG